MSYRVELVWNREFDFVGYGGTHENIKSAIKLARDMEESGNGERVKKTRVVDEDGNVVWEYGRMVGSKKAARHGH